MNIGALWDQLVCAVCRPPRDIYEESDLVGGRRAAFAFGESRARIRKYYRQDVELRNPQGERLQASWYRPCITTSRDGRLPCVIFCHTNAGSRRDAESIIFHLLPRGITVFALDFSGSGLSDGQWVTLGARETDDLAAAVAYLRAEGSTSTLALWGRSMGAVTALLYAHRDPSIAGVVADSPFSRLVDLMVELGTDPAGGLSVPRPLIKVALGLLRRSVRRRAGFSIDSVTPLDVAPETFVPTLFGHAADDTFVPPHHTERLFLKHGAETKNMVFFEGDHNAPRPDFWYDSAVCFLVGVLRVEELVGPEVDLTAIDPGEAPHMSGQGIYVAGGGGEGPGESEEEQVVEEVVGEGGRRRSLAAPWEFGTTKAEGAVAAAGGLGRGRSEVAALTRPHGAGDDGEEDDVLQQVIALSLAEAAEARTAAAAVAVAAVDGLSQPSAENGAAEPAGANGEAYDEEAALAAAIAESLRDGSGEPGLAPAAVAVIEPEPQKDKPHHLHDSQASSTRHATAEAAAVHPAAEQVQHALAEETARLSEGLDEAPRQPEGGVNGGEDEEAWLETLRAQAARLSGGTVPPLTSSNNCE